MKIKKNFAIIYLLIMLIIISIISSIINRKEKFELNNFIKKNIKYDSEFARKFNNIKYNNYIQSDKNCMYKKLLNEQYFKNYQNNKESEGCIQPINVDIWPRTYDGRWVNSQIFSRYTYDYFIFWPPESSVDTVIYVRFAVTISRYPSNLVYENDNLNLNIELFKYENNRWSSIKIWNMTNTDFKNSIQTSIDFIKFKLPTYTNPYISWDKPLPLKVYVNNDDISSDYTLSLDTNYDDIDNQNNPYMGLVLHKQYV